MNDHPRWVPIARLTNLAEAGFFEATLAESGIDARVDQRDEFDAVAGHWQSVFVLQVSEADASYAGEVIEQQLRSSADKEAEAGEVAEHGANEPRDIDLQPWGQAVPGEEGGWALWRPFLLVVLAAGLVYLAVQAGRPRARGQRPPDVAPLWNTLIESREPLRGAHRELRYDERQRLLIVIDDVDGDRQADIRREFRDGQLVREIHLNPTP